MAENITQLGKLIEGYAGRDAIHIAVTPMIAGEDLPPGGHVLLRDGKAYHHHERAKNTVGIVDPFLASGCGPRKGDAFWLCLYPGTVTSLRHVWEHPAFTYSPLKASE